MFNPSRTFLLLSLQSALLGNVHHALRQASIEVDSTARVVKLRFEYADQQYAQARELCSAAAAEVIADFPSEWNAEDEHVLVEAATPLRALALVAYRRAE